MNHVKVIRDNNLRKQKDKGCGECQNSCQSACKTSCTIGNQECQSKKVSK